MTRPAARVDTLPLAARRRAIVFWQDGGVDILPGQGVGLARIGETRAQVEARIGLPVHGPGSNKAVYDTLPGLVISYYPDDTVEIVEVAYSGDGGAEVFFNGVQLTYRFLDDVVADLNVRGYTCTPTDIGFAFHEGFAVWSMGSRWARDLDPNADEDDQRRVVEGVSVAPYGYFTDDIERPQGRQDRKA